MMLTDADRKAAKELHIRVQRIMAAPADVWAVGDIIGCLKDCGEFISAFLPEPASAGQLAPEGSTLTGTFCLPVDRLGPAEVLMLFRAFVNKNAISWAVGAGDHHHPIWEHVALNVEGPEPVRGARWAYIQPLNRERLTVLELAEEARQEQSG